MAGEQLHEYFFSSLCTVIFNTIIYTKTSKNESDNRINETFTHKRIIGRCIDHTSNTTHMMFLKKGYSVAIFVTTCFLKINTDVGSCHNWMLQSTWERKARQYTCCFLMVTCFSLSVHFLLYLLVAINLSTADNNDILY